MNYLAHLFLSPPGEDALLGSILGDFIKGPINGDLRQRYGSDTTHAIMLHRKIDSFTDSHPIVVESRNRISRERRRFAGVMIDVFYDHFLAKYWIEFHSRSLRTFTADFYAILARRHDDLPKRMQRVARSMIELDWLGSYASMKSIDTALNRMSLRLRRENSLAGSAAELAANYAELESDFRNYLPEAMAFARSQFSTLNAKPGSTGD